MNPAEDITEAFSLIKGLQPALKRMNLPTELKRVCFQLSH